MPATLTPLRRESARTPVGAPLAADASTSRVVAALSRTAWVQSVLRATAFASNLSFAHSRIAVLGAGPVAAELATRLAAMGARVVVVDDDAVALLEFSQQGFAVSTTGRARLGDAIIAFATGESPAPVTAGSLGTGGPLLLVDAGEADPAVSASTDPASGRPGIARLSGSDREAFLLVAREVVDGSARRTRESAAARFAALVAAEEAADPRAALDELHARADRALATELLA